MKDDIEEREFGQLSQLDHVKTRPDMYIGSVDLQKTLSYIKDDELNKFIQTECEFSIALIKIIDEPLVNAIDQYSTYPTLVNRISVDYDLKDGCVTIENNGPGIDVKRVDTIHDGSIFKPQACFSQFLAGDNFKDDADKVVGGRNGLGATVTNAFSNIFTIETFDTKTKQLYKQTFKNRLLEIEEPVITKLDKKAIDLLSTYKQKGFTKISFTPDYMALGYPKYNEKYGNIIKKIIEFRVHQTATFVNKKIGNKSANHCSVFLYGEEITEPQFPVFANMLLNNEYGTYNTTLTGKNSKFDMDVCIGISDGKLKQNSLINGISINKGGTHIKHICNEIIRLVKPNVEAALASNKIKFNQNLVLNNLHIITKCSIAVNELQFDSQSKEEVSSKIDIFKDFKFKESESKKIWAFLEPHIMASILGKIQDTAKTKVTRGKIMFTQGNDAKFAGDKKKASLTGLVIAEGNSALSLMERGINHKKTELDRDYYGTWSIQGVPPNARKEIKIIYDKINKKNKRIRNAKLQNNKRFNELVKIIGLDYEKSYTVDTPEGDTEMKTLRYGCVIVATDADTDGKGQIFGLIMNFFALFWPDLVKRCFIKRFNTPIVRAYPKNVKEVVQQFYTIHAYDNWIKEKFGGDNELATIKYRIKYYKGLGGNDENEILPTFSNFTEKLNIYEYDDEANNNLEIFFGKDTAPRKEILSTPVQLENIINCDKTYKITVTDFLKTDVKEFQRDNIIRKLPYMVDGMVPSRRKVFFTARLNKSMSTKETKVVNFTGEVISKTGYTHGDASLSGTIIKMAQRFVGAKNLPLLIGVGQFGSRLLGGNDAASPRYIYIKYNKDLGNALFPPQDDYLLKYMFEDGERVEPEYYVPIIPMGILENMQLPATGWRVKIWARDFKGVMKNVKRLVNCEITKCKKLGVWMRGNNCDIRVGSDGKEYMVGKYVYNEKANTITITELPISVFNDKYIKAVALAKDGTYIKEIKDHTDYSNYDEETNIDEVKIVFELTKGSMETIMSTHAAALANPKKKKIMTVAPKKKISDVSSNAGSEKTLDEIIADDLADDDDFDTEVVSYTPDSLFDAVEEFFKLRLRIDSDLNMIDQIGEVREIEYYGTIVNIWFEERKQLYKERITRSIFLCEMMISYLENIIRFAEERDKMNITNNTLEKKFVEILKKNKFDTFNKTLLFNPKYINVDELRNRIINSEEASFDYIINLTYRSMLKEECDKRKEELKKERVILAELEDDIDDSEGCFVGQKTWLKEIDALETIIDKGIKKGWGDVIKANYA
jgi:DNA topoisomerase-2